MYLVGCVEYQQSAFAVAFMCVCTGMCVHVWFECGCIVCIYTHMQQQQRIINSNPNRKACLFEKTQPMRSKAQSSNIVCLLSLICEFARAWLPINHICIYIRVGKIKKTNVFRFEKSLNILGQICGFLLNFVTPSLVGI